MRKEKQQWLWSIFLLYCAGMCWLLFDRPGMQEGAAYKEQLLANLNLIPLHTVRLYLRVLERGGSLRNYAIINLLGNVVLFIPFGIFLPGLFPKLEGFWKTVTVATLAIMAVELIQLFTLVGSCDVDDLLLNLAGVCIGFGINEQIKKKRSCL